MIRQIDVIEVYPFKRKLKGAKRSAKAVIIGWRFRMFKAGTDEAMLVSEGLYPTPERAAEVAGKFNDACYGGHYPITEVKS
jgi:hypothetical protein